MSNIFITDIIGAGDFAVPVDDAALATATTELDTLLGGVANLSYDRVLAWVETNNGASPPRTLNCVVEKFEYSGEECPDSTETQTMTAAIESTLEGDPDITSIGIQQVHIFQAGPYFLWDRYAGPGYVFPSISTDDVIVGGLAAPTGKWFDDGDLVLGDDVLSGSERTRVVGNARIEGGFLMTEQASVPISPGAGEGVFWVYNNGSGETRPYFTDDVGVDHELATTGTSISLPKIDHVVWVDKTSVAYSADGTRQAPYNTVAAAITEAAGLNCDKSGQGDSISGTAPNMTLTDAAGLFSSSMVGRYITLSNCPTASNDGTFLITGYTSATQISYSNANGVAETITNGLWVVPYYVAIIVHPGIYVESLSLANGYVSIVGLDRDSTIIRQSSGSNNVMTLTKGNTSFENITFETSGTATGYIFYGNITSGPTLYNPVTFRNCAFLGTAGSTNNQFYLYNKEDYFFYDCLFRQGNQAYVVFNTEAAYQGYTLRMFGCEFYGTAKLHAAYLKHYFYDCYFYTNDSSSYNAPVYLQTDGIRRFHNCTFRNDYSNGHGVYCSGTMDPGAEFYNCSFITTGAGAYSITGSNVAYVIVSGCPMTHGMSYLISQKTPIVYGGGVSGEPDWYKDLYEAVYALRSVTYNQDATVYMGSDFSGSLYFRSGINVTIDGRRRFTITCTTATPDANTVRYKDLKWVGQMRNNVGASLILERVYLDGSIDLFRNMNAGDRVVIHDSSIKGSSSYVRPIAFHSGITYSGNVIVSKSYIKGYTGYAAVDYENGSANSALKIEYSKLFHGDLGTSNPFSRYANGTVYAAHHTTFNQEPALADPTNLTNSIDSGQRNNCIDPDGDFDTMNDPF